MKNSRSIIGTYLILTTLFAACSKTTSSTSSSSITVDGKSYNNLTVRKGGSSAVTQLFADDFSGSFVNAEVMFDFGSNYPTSSGTMKIGKKVDVNVLVGYGSGSGTAYSNKRFFLTDTTKSISYSVVSGKVTKLNCPLIWVYKSGGTGGKDSVQVSATDITEP